MKALAETVASGEALGVATTGTRPELMPRRRDFPKPWLFGHDRCVHLANDCISPSDRIVRAGFGPNFPVFHLDRSRNRPAETRDKEPMIEVEFGVLGIRIAAEVADCLAGCHPRVAAIGEHLGIAGISR